MPIKLLHICVISYFPEPTTKNNKLFFIYVMASVAQSGHPPVETDSDEVATHSSWSDKHTPERQTHKQLTVRWTPTQAMKSTSSNPLTLPSSTDT